MPQQFLCIFVMRYITIIIDILETTCGSTLFFLKDFSLKSPVLQCLTRLWFAGLTVCFRPHQVFTWKISSSLIPQERVGQPRASSVCLGFGLSQKPVFSMVLDAWGLLFSRNTSKSRVYCFFSCCCCCRRVFFQVFVPSSLIPSHRVLLPFSASLGCPTLKDSAPSRSLEAPPLGKKTQLRCLCEQRLTEMHLGQSSKVLQISISKVWTSRLS